MKDNSSVVADKLVRDLLYNSWDLDNPGILYNVLSKKYGEKDSKKRIMLVFEDSVSELWNSILCKKGKEEGSFLLYKMGKDIGYRYLLHGRIKEKIPLSSVSSVVRYVLNCTRGAGMSLSEDVRFNEESEELILSGSDNIICRNVGSGDFFAGLVSGFVSCILGKNIEAEVNCCCPSCRIILSPKIKKKYIPDSDRIFPSKDFFLLNFPVNTLGSKVFFSLRDFLIFNKIKIEKGKLLFRDKPVTVATPEFFGLMQFWLEVEGESKLLEEAVISSSEKLAPFLFSYGDLQCVAKLLIAFGWGKVFFKKSKDRVDVVLSYLPYNEFGYLYNASVINGYINYVLRGKYKINSIDFDKSSLCLRISYFKVLH
jgi:hypothetical protein